MDHEFTITFTRDHLVKAARRYVIRSLGWKAAVVLIVSIGLVAWLVAQGERDWIVGALGTALGMMVIFILAVYRTVVGRALRRFAQMPDKSVRFRLSEAAMATESDLGEAEAPWRQFTDLWRYPDVWLLIYGPGAYITLPADQLTEPVRRFILDRLAQHHAAVR